MDFAVGRVIGALCVDFPPSQEPLRWKERRVYEWLRQKLKDCMYEEFTIEVFSGIYNENREK